MSYGFVQRAHKLGNLPTLFTVRHYNAPQAVYTFHFFNTAILYIMKNSIVRRLSIFALILGSFMPSLIHAQAFEGVVYWEMSIPMLGDQKIPVTINIKGDKTVSIMDVPMQGSMKMYTDRATRKMTMVQEAQKQGMEMDLAKMDEMKKMSQDSSIPKLTGKKDKIKGYNAEEYSTTADGGIEVDLWLSKEMPKEIAAGINSSNESSMQSQFNSSKNAAFTALFKKGYAPLRTVVKKDGDVQMTMEFTKVESKKLNDSLFVIASDITIQKMDPSMMNPNAGDGQSTQDAPPPQPILTDPKKN